MILRIPWRIVPAALVLAAALCRPVAAADVNAFIYHRFGESRYPSTNISVEDFEAHLAWLDRKQRPVLALSEVVERLRSGDRLPDGAVVLTVDDAFRSFLEDGMPVLRRYGFPVTLFVSTDAVGTPGYLTWEELAGLAAEGVEIGNHSASHDYLLERRADESTVDWRRRIREDIARAQQVLSRRLGTAPSLFAYPYGEYSPSLQELVRELGFTAAVAQQSGVITGGGDFYALPRFPMGGPYASPEDFRAKARMQAMPVEVLSPDSPVLEEGEGPPRLRLRIGADRIRGGQLRCFVQGDNTCRIEAAGEGVFTVVADRPLTGRRNKYTVTAAGEEGGWFWFSQPWFFPERPGSGY